MNRLDYLLVVALSFLFNTGAFAAEPAVSSVKSQEASEAPASIASSLGSAGDPGGVRAALSERGIEYGLTYIGEGLANTTGGVRRGGVYQGRLELSLDADLGKLAGWSGGAFHIGGFQIHGEGLSRGYVGNLLTVSNIEALTSTRFYEIWFEQKFAGDKAALRIGQLAADTEFVTSQYAGLFINATFGFPAIAGAALPGGGPAYPFATPGVRLKVTPTEDLTFLLGVFNGDPAGRGFGDPQRRNSHGTRFPLEGGTFAIGEVAYSWNQSKDAAGLPGTIKLGAWYHSAAFDDQRFGLDGLSLADPSGLGRPRRHRGDQSIYAILDQMIYRVPDTKDQGIGFFARVSAAPGDSNLIDVYVDGGLSFKGLLASRPDDTFGIAASYARISGQARGLDQDVAFFSGAYQPTRDYEALLELTYQAQIVPGWTVQPDFQYIIHPGGRVLDPNDPFGVRTLKDAVVVGLRTTIKY
jgi:porin